MEAFFESDEARAAAVAVLPMSATPLYEGIHSREDAMTAYRLYHEAAPLFVDALAERLCLFKSIYGWIRSVGWILNEEVIDELTDAVFYGCPVCYILDYMGMPPHGTSARACAIRIIGLFDDIADEGIPTDDSIHATIGRLALILVSWIASDGDPQVDEADCGCEFPEHPDDYPNAAA